ncbi:MAG: anti-sigma factor [Oscillatoriophycideae cyanobacterium NC_groundwater_1537_Pr4_S-0.65um_50_18]|nr:anti-sigma factor [Oscillatoriophycideae cyanobacterium NC_groundwater_1537_Pr4_S-0.65um_50_18]
MARSIPSEISEHLQLMIAGYVLGDLDPNEATEFEQILTADPAIAAEVAQMQQALELSYASPEVKPPSHLRSAIMAAQVATQDATSQHRPRAAQKARLFPWGRAMGVAAAVLIVALGINNYQLRQALQAAESQPQPMPTSGSLTYVLERTAALDRASATVVVNPNTLKANLTIRNLPPLPPGKVYVLWTVLKQGAPFTTDQKEAILTKVLNVDAEGSISQSIAVPVVYQSKELVSRVAITVEDAAAPQQHEGTPVMITSL